MTKPGREQAKNDGVEKSNELDTLQNSQVIMLFRPKDERTRRYMKMKERTPIFKVEVKRDVKFKQVLRRIRQFIGLTALRKWQIQQEQKQNQMHLLSNDELNNVMLNNEEISSTNIELYQVKQQEDFDVLQRLNANLPMVPFAVKDDAISGSPDKSDKDYLYWDNKDYNLKITNMMPNVYASIIQFVYTLNIDEAELGMMKYCETQDNLYTDLSKLFFCPQPKILNPRINVS